MQLITTFLSKNNKIVSKVIDIIYKKKFINQ